MKSGTLFGVIIGAVALVMTIVVFVQPQATLTLESIHERMEKRHPDLAHITADELQALDASDVFIIDTRTEDEYAISHIAGAGFLSPHADEDDIERLRDQIAGRHVVLYCSVGVRSSALGARMRTTFDALGAESVANLEGGVFRWHNEGRPLVNAEGETRLIHPFNPHWGELIDDRTAIQYPSQ